MKNNLIVLADKYDNKYNVVSKLEILKLAYIRKTPEGKWRVLSEKGKNLGTFNSKEKAEKRLQQVEYFKHVKKKKASAEDCIDLTDLKELSYSAVMRELRQQCDNDVVKDFLVIYKKIFDKLISSKEKGAADKAMIVTLISFGKKHKVEISHD